MDSTCFHGVPNPGVLIMFQTRDPGRRVSIGLHPSARRAFSSVFPDSKTGQPKQHVENPEGRIVRHQNVNASQCGEPRALSSNETKHEAPEHAEFSLSLPTTMQLLLSASASPRNQKGSTYHPRLLGGRRSCCRSGCRRGGHASRRPKSSGP